MADSNDRLGGYTLRELLDTHPVSKSPTAQKKDERKRGVVSTVLGAPFRLVAALIKLPVTVVTKLVTGVTRAIGEVLKLPVRLVGALVSPWKRNRTSS